MRGTVAKRIRREVYGEMAPRNKTYGIVRHVFSVFDPDKKKSEDIERHEIRSTGLRAEYQKRKREYKRAALRCAV